MAIGGRSGSVRWSSSTSGSPALVADLREWTANVTADMFDVTTFGSSGWRRFMPNMNGASGSLSGFFAVQTSTTERAIMQKVFGLSTAPGTLVLIVDNAAGNGFVGDAWVSQLSLGASVDAIVPFGASFTYHGPVAYSTTL
jgi:predicted secreted protein